MDSGSGGMIHPFYTQDYTQEDEKNKSEMKSNY